MFDDHDKLNPSSHAALSDFLNMDFGTSVVPTEKDLMCEQARLISSVIRHLSYKTGMPAHELYLLLKQTGTIDYLIEEWKVLHSFDMRKTIEYVVRFHNRRGSCKL